MLATRNFDEFYRHNNEELRSLVGSICKKHDVADVDDTMQDVYTHILSAKILDKYDPSRRTKISTFLYPVIKNLVLSKKKENMEMILRNRYDPPENYGRAPFHNTSDNSDLPFDIALHSGHAVTEYMNMVHQNGMTDNADGLGADLRDFVNRFLEGKTPRGLERNKVYTLAKRKTSQPALLSGGCRLSDVYFFLYEGLNNKEIAEVFGVSNMFVSVMKRELSHIMERGGVVRRIRRIRKTRRKTKLTLKEQLARILKRSGPMKLSAIYKKVAKYRPNSPESSIRARIYGSIQNNEGIFRHLPDGRYAAAVRKW